MVLSIGKTGAPTFQEIDVHSIIPYETRTPNTELMHKLREQARNSVIDLVVSMNTLPSTIGDDLFRERNDLSVLYLKQLEHSLDKSPSLRSFLFRETIDNVELIHEEMTLVQGSIANRALREPISKVVIALEGLREVLKELNQLVKETLPTLGEMQLVVSGSLAEVQELGKRLRSRAIEIIRERQQEEADEHQWKTVKNQAGEVVLYQAPIGSHVPPAHPIVDIESPQVIARVISDLPGSLDQLSFPSVSGARAEATVEIDDDELMDLSDEMTVSDL